MKHEQYEELLSRIIEKYIEAGLPPMNSIIMVTNIIKTGDIVTNETLEEYKKRLVCIEEAAKITKTYLENKLKDKEEWKRIRNN